MKSIDKDDLFLHEPSGNGVKYLSMMGSISHTYGNALAYIEKWLIDLFPKNLFKTIHVNSKIAHRQLKSTPHEFTKKLKPMFIIRPRIDYDGERFLRGTMLTDRRTALYNQWGQGHLEPFFIDYDKKIAIKYQLTRSVMYADVVLVFSTLMQQINFMQYIQNAVTLGIPFNLNTFFESYISQEMLLKLSELSGIPLYDKNGSTKEFLDYMQQHSMYPITYKLQGSTGTREFYRYYPVTIDTLIDSLSCDEGEKTGHVMSSYQITFTVRMEFYTSGFYFLFSDDIDKLTNIEPSFPEDDAVVPIFTDPILHEDLNLHPGWTLYQTASCILEESEQEISFTSMINTSIQAIMDYHKKNGLPYFDFIDIKIRKQGEMLLAGKDYEINYDNATIKFHTKSYGYFTYRIFLYVNIEYINNMVKTIYHLK